jgi:mRNA interferase YafQ
MRTIRRTRGFKRDFKREKRGQYRLTLDQDLELIVGLLLNDEAIPEHFQDHTMRGDRGHERNCHIHPDLVLIYRKLNAADLELLRLGSHSELGI